jgi:hypothetical protein
MSLRTYKKDGVERSAPRLLCDGQTHCNTGSCLFEEMMDKICGILRECIKDFEIRIQNNEGDSIKLHASLVKRLEKQLHDLQAKEELQWDQQSDPDPAKRMPQDIFQRLNAKLLKEKEEVQQALCKAKESMPEHIDYTEKMAKFQNALDTLLDPDIDAETKNRVLKACIERITYKREKPQRLRSTAKRVTVNGRRIRPDGLPTGGNWTTPPIELDVKLKM